jgi:hypothetical protein
MILLMRRLESSSADFGRLENLVALARLKPD